MKNKIYSGNIITSKIFLEHIAPFIIIILSFTFIIWIIESIKIIELIINHGASISFFLEISLYLLPYMLYIIMPLCVLFTVLYIAKKLYDNGELIALESLGFSYDSLIKPFFYFSITVAILHYFISLYILPASYKHFKTLEANLRNNYAALILEEGVFSNKINGLTIYIDNKSSINTFNKIFIYDTQNERQKIVIMAEYAELQYIKDDDVIELNMHNGSYQDTDLLKNRNSMLFFKNYVLKIKLNTSNYNAAVSTPDANERYINQMLWDVDEVNEKKRNKIIVYGHKRILWPIYNILITLIIISTVLKYPYSRGSNQNRFILSFIICFVFILLNFITEHISMKNLSYIFLIYLNLFLPIIYIKILNYYK